MKRYLWILVFFYFIILVSCSPGPDTSSSKSNEEPNHQEDIISDPPTKDESKPSESFPKQIRDLALNGKGLNSEFTLKTNIQRIYENWGNPDYKDKYNENFYVTYEQRGITFGFYENGEIFDIRSYDDKLQSLTYDEISAALGEPTDTRSVNDESIYVYKLNEEMELKFIIPNKSGRVDHTSVFLTEKIDDTSNINKDYILEIKGTSNNLSEKAWTNMLKSRAEMLALAKSYPKNIFLNGSNQKKVALTFDDGPDKTVTPAILNILARYNVKGNFFFVGEKVRLYPEIVKTAYDDGNLVLSHSYYHNDLSKRGKDDITRDLVMTNDAIQDVIGKSPAMFRPPYGATNNFVLSSAQENNLKIVLWSIDTLDWSQKESAHIKDNVLNNVRNGDIILMHSDEDKTETEKALPLIIEGLKNKGFQMVTLDILINEAAYK
ncbi:peptidoglycan/xylan/chitin deacetylase (PgdA/CDA1 family) [Neobacillus niacini]|uniref:polysaccharide deacetylase family protein n=1 Tax=Neobacillus driksii TaxID=3035913 RepID=UPI00278B69EE|nr:polysaccharide deacetylase family protein [Neobacillus niacini]MDQ0971179.1 peptidoglycan/xylan/chitin deacetylase (PgdA/CDA1 family) [Neobacillus niacini]